MGRDIHLCVEKRRCKKGWLKYYKPTPNYKEYEKAFTPVGPDSEWESCAISFFRPWGERYYGMFDKLMNLKREFGLPKDVHIRTFYESVLRVVPDLIYNDDDFETISESAANDLIISGWSKEITHPNAPAGDKFITHPDYHSAKWCSCKELEDAVKEVFFEDEIGEYIDDSNEWFALIGYMKGLEMAGYETRCVFGFDN